MNGDALEGFIGSEERADLCEMLEEHLLCLRIWVSASKTWVVDEDLVEGGILCDI
jgi:GTPase Era involved in 16S rRNA processing